MPSQKLMDAAEVAKHNSSDNCWVILYGNVYDVTQFLPDHPGGPGAILALAGRDATSEYDPIHPRGLLESTLPKSALIGRVTPFSTSTAAPPSSSPAHPSSTTGQPHQPTLASPTSLSVPGSAYPMSWSPPAPYSWTSTNYPSSLASAPSNDAGRLYVPGSAYPFSWGGGAGIAGNAPPLALPREEGKKLSRDELENVLNLTEFESLAQSMLSDKAWAYYSSAGDDLVSKSRNTSDYRAIVFRPRVFRDMSVVDTRSSMLGFSVGLPIYISPAAMARLGHPEGEWGIGRACGKNGIMQLISNNASQSVEDVVHNPYPEPAKGCYASATSTPTNMGGLSIRKREGQQLWGFQLYISTDIKKSEEMLKRVEKTGRYAFVALTLDAVWPGKREADERVRNSSSPVQKSAIGTGGLEKKNEKGLARALFSGMASDMTWQKTLPWLRKSTSLPIVLKGIQTWEDAVLASKAEGVKGIIVSNHGGRSLDTAPSAVQVLLEIRRHAPEVFDRIEVWVDGGVKRGTDVVKALCLGAKAVGIGRAALYGLGVGGIEGVERTIQILRDEVETTLRLLGCQSVRDLGMHYVNTKALDSLIWDAGSKEDLLDYKRKAKL